MPLYVEEATFTWGCRGRIGYALFKGRYGKVGRKLQMENVRNVSSELF